MHIFNLFYCFFMLFYEADFRKYLFCFTLLSVVFLATSSVLAQESPSRYEGKYVYADSIWGNAVYQYRTEDRDTIKQGEFTFESVDERFEEEHTVSGISVSGNYADNLKEGAWEYTHQELTLTGMAKLRGSTIGYDANGTEFLIHANFQRGKAHGDYEMVQRRVAQSKPTDTLFYAKLQYQNGESTGSFSGFVPGMEVTGQFDEEGFPNGDWLIAHHSDSGENMEELRRYDHGFFLKHFYKMDDDLVEIKHTGFDTVATSGLGLLTHIRARPAYFRALDYTPIVMEHVAEDEAQEILPLDTVQAYIVEANAFLERVFVRPAIYREKDVWKAAGGSESVLPTKLKIREFSFSPEVSSLNQDNEILLRETQTLIQSVIENPNMEVTRFADQEVGFYYEVLGIYLQNLEQAKPVVDFLADIASEYVNHDEILAHNVRQISYSGTVEYPYQDSIRTRPYTFPPALTATDTRALNEHLKLVYADVNTILSQLENAVKGYEVKSELMTNEQELISLRDTVIRVFNNTDSNDTYNELHESVRDSVRHFVERSFAAYAEGDSYQRISRVDSIQRCFSYFLKFYEELSIYHENLDKLEQEYIRRVWNPFTFTHMEERVKKRLYDAFEEEIFPYLWKDVKSNISCGRLPGKIQNLKTLLERMAELRWQDTKALERELRRARNDVPRYLEILDLDFDIK